MIRHIVMWKLDESYSLEEKKKFVFEFGNQLLQLNGKIKELQSISVEYNSPEASAENYDLMLNTSFNSIEDLKIYAGHPEHIAVVEFSKSHKKSRSCIDFEY